MKLYLKLRGEHSNSWPILTISQCETKFEYEITENFDISLDLNNEPFSIGMFNKNFGTKRIWDTKVDTDGKIIQDKIIWVDRLEIDEVDITNILKNIDYKSIENGYISVGDKCLRFNGYWNFDIGDNPYDWIIDARTQKTNQYRTIGYHSDYTLVGKYDEHHKYIDKIKKLLNV